MRTINNNMYDRLEAQLEEAKVLKLEKVASSVRNVLNKNVDAVRESDTGYLYSSKELEDDVNNNLWDAALRAMDYFGIIVDSELVQESIEKLGAELIEEIRVRAGVASGVGPYEGAVPGEVASQTLEVNES